VLLALPAFTSRRDWRDLLYAASATGSLYRSPLAIIAQAILAILLASANRGNLSGPRREPRSVPGAMDLGIADYGQSADGEQAAQIAVALLLLMLPSLSLPPLEFCFGTRPTQAEVPL
jgi:hypothetical protein